MIGLFDTKRYRPIVLGAYHYAGHHKIKKYNTHGHTCMCPEGIQTGRKSRSIVQHRPWDSAVIYKRRGP